MACNWNRPKTTTAADSTDRQIFAGLTSSLFITLFYKTVFNTTSRIFYVTLQAPVYALFPHTFTIFRSSGDLSTEPELEPKPAMDQLGGEGELLTATGFLDAKGQLRGLRYLRVLSPLTPSPKGR